MNKIAQKIGFVLPNVPNYSETFISSVVYGLRQNGNYVVLFARGNKKDSRFDKVINPLPTKYSHLISGPILVLIVIKLLILSPKQLFHYIKVVLEDGAGYTNIFKLLYINGHILSHKLDWLYFGYANQALLREQIAGAIGAKMAVSIRGTDIGLTPIKFEGCYNLTWKHIDKLHYLSDDLLSKARKFGFPPDKPSQKIPPAIKVENYLHHTINESIDTKHLKIITVARLHWKKGLDYGLEVLAAIKKKGINFTYTIIGGGDQYERLCLLSHQLNIKDNVIFAGIKTHEEVKDALFENEIFIMPSVQEGFCNAVLEAQAAGLFCIVSDAEGLPENVLNGETGLVVQRRNVVELTKAIEWTVHAQQNDVYRMRIRSRARVGEQFNLPNYFREWNRFFTDV